MGAGFVVFSGGGEDAVYRAEHLSIAALFLRCTAWGDNGSRAASGSLGDYANSAFVNFLVTFIPIQLPS